jgi:hypothetical protein
MAKPNWITVNPSSGTGAGIFKITFAQNTSTSSRSGIVTVKSLSGLTHKIQVTQEGKATKGKITFRCTTGEEIPQKYVGYSLYIGDSKVGSPEFYAEYGEIESITADTMVVNFNNMAQINLEMTLATIHTDMTETDDIYFGISSSDDPELDWVPLLYVTETGSESFTSDNMAVIIQNAFNGISEIIDAESLVTSSVTDVVCSWSMPSTRLLLAGTTQDVLDSASVSSVKFSVFADLYPDGQRLLNDNSMNNIQIGQFTLGESSDGKWLSRGVNISKISTIQQFTWYKEWSEVALCRFTIKCNFSDVDVHLSDNLVINGKTFMQHKNDGGIYFENTEGIPLQKTTDSQNVSISSNTPYLDFTALN